jgi:hypothetical protein
VTWTQALLFAFIAGLAVVSWRLARPRLRLLVTERGILDRRLRLGWIHWDEIEGAYEPSAQDSDGLRLRLRVSERLGRKLRRRATRVAAPGAESMDVRLDLSDSDISPLELLQQILSRTGRRQD